MIKKIYGKIGLIVLALLLSISSVNAQLSTNGTGVMPVRTCPETIPASMNLFGIIMVMFVGIYFGMRIPIIGLLAGLGLFISSFYLIGCSSLEGVLVGFMGFCSFLYFAFLR